MRHSPHITVSALVFIASTFLIASGANAGDEPFIGRCHMGVRLWYCLREKKLIQKKGDDAVLYEVRLLGGTSEHTGGYPEKYDPGVSIEWDASPSTVTAFCYFKLPVMSL